MLLIFLLSLFLDFLLLLGGDFLIWVEGLESGLVTIPLPLTFLFIKIRDVVDGDHS